MTLALIVLAVTIIGAFVSLEVLAIRAALREDRRRVL